MSIFKKLFGFEKKENTNTRTFGNLDRALKTGYLEDYQTAENAYLSGNLAEALNYINSTIKKSDISDWKHYAFRANVYEDQQKFSDAITDYNKAIELSNSELSVYQLYHQIGYCYLNLGNNKKAEEFYTAAIDIKKRHPNSEYNPDMEGMMGGVLMGLPFERLYNNRGNARKNLGRLQEGFEDCEKAIEYNPGYSNSYLLAGQIKQLAGKLDEAVHFLNHSIKRGNPNAQRLLDSIIASNPDIIAAKEIAASNQLFQKSMEACDNGDYKTAIRLGNELLLMHMSPKGYYALGLVYTLMEKYELAIQYGLESYKFFPQDKHNLNRLGVSYCSIGNIREGLTYFKKGIELGDANCQENYHYWRERL